ncbi:MAG: chalcone isomerase family protein [Sideroxydans sp.]|nr:chalcone isomerase family protein [Sideroxydans sp.]
MKKLLMVLAAVLLSLSLHAKEISGVNVAESSALGGKNLLLNGAGTRTKMMFDIYVAALYRSEKSKLAESILADVGARRMSLHMLFGLKSEKLLEAFTTGIAANQTPAQLAALDTPLKKFAAIFAAIPEVKKGDVILLDYVPEVGTTVSVNGVERGVIAGVEFNRALLSVWLGNKPVDADLKKDLLGVW